MNWRKEACGFVFLFFLVGGGVESQVVSRKFVRRDTWRQSLAGRKSWLSRRESKN